MAIIAEDLLLLLLDDATGKPVVDSTKLDTALAGAVLLELALLGRVDQGRAGEEVKRGRIVVRDDSPTGDAVLDEGLRRVAAKAPVRPESVLGRLAKDLRGVLLARLADRGVLRRESGRALGLFPTTRWPADDSRAETALRQQLRDVLVVGRSAEPRLLALVSLLSAVDAAPRVVGAEDRRAVKRRAKELAEGEWAGAAVKKAVAAVNAAVAAAVVAAGSAAAAGS